MSRQMSTMISSGLSLLRALSILSAQTENKKLAGILQQVTVDVENGGSLSDSFAKHPVDFPPLMINMIRAGETGGFLEGALESLAVNYEKEAKLRSAIKSAMAYPVMVLVMSFVAVLLMLIFIVPVFKEMFDGLGSQLPVPTQMLVTVSENMIWIAPAARRAAHRAAACGGARTRTRMPCAASSIRSRSRCRSSVSWSARSRSPGSRATSRT